MRAFKGSLNSVFYPLHPSQEDVFYEQALYENTPIHSLSWYTALKENIDIAILQKAWDLLHQHIDTLRLQISINSDNEVVQYIPELSKPELIRCYDATIQPEPEKHALTWMRQQSYIPVNYLKTTPYQVTLIRLNNKKHYLFTQFHHIMIDSVGLYRLHEYIYQLYGCIKQGLSTAWLSDIPQYLTSIENARDYLNSIHYTNDKNYWVDFLREKEIHHLTPYYKNNEAGYHSLTLPFSAKENLLAFCHQHKTHLLAVFSSLVTIMMTELTGQKALIFNTVTHGRRTKAEKYAVGMQANTYPVHCHISPTFSVMEQIKGIESALKNSYKHSQFPQSHLARLASQQGFSLPDIFIAYDRYSASATEINQNQHCHIDGIFNIYPIAFRLKDHGYDQELTITVDYLQAYFNDADIQNALERLQNLLAALIDNPSVLVRELPILLEQERQSLLRLQQPADIAYPQDKTLQQHFEAQAAVRPDNTAVVFEDETLTYRQLNERANQLAVVIRERYQQQHNRSMPVNTLVALYLERSTEMVLSILAVLKAGGAYVPVSPDYPSERVRFILEDTGSFCVITQQKYLPVLNKYAPAQTVLIAADDHCVTENRATENPVCAGQATDLAYVIYTSGTTGQPKGVLQTHANVARLFASTQEDYQFNQDDIWVLYHSYAFDFSVWELWGALRYGGCLIIPTAECTKDFDKFSDLCSARNVTVLNQTPGAFYAFIDASLKAGAEFPHLRYVIFGGDKLNPMQLKPWWNFYGDQAPALINMYGITETTVHVTYKKLTQSDATAVSCIGRPLRDMSAYILNHSGQLAPIGAPGELYIGGAGLASGYLNRPELTAERFVENPFATDKEKESGYTRLYKTGDLARWLPNGELEYLGRNDFQVTIRGYRIELGEIESALASHPEVKQAVVIDREYQGNKVLVAYLVSHEELSDEALISHLSALLPDYMLPASFTHIESIPLTQNGKVDRRVLPEPAFGNKAGSVSPRNELESRLCDLWQTVLGVKQVGIEDNFFRLGGNSLTAIKLISAIRQQLGLEVSLSQFFEFKTIAGIAAQMAQANGMVIAHIEQEHYPLSFAQERMLFIERFEQGTYVYHVPYLVQLDDNTDLPLLESAINQVVDRHPIMKTVYRTDARGHEYQQVLAENLRFKSQSCQDMHTLLRSVRAEIATPFDLVSEPSLRVCHYQVAESHYLLFLWHHIATDGWSTDIFTTELAESYHALLQGRPSQLPALEISYGDYARWQREYLQGEVHAQQLAYWQHTLAGFETLDLPTDYSRPAQVSYQGRDVTFTLNSVLSEQLRALAKAEETTLYTVLLSAFYVMLAKLSGQKDIVLGTPTDNRHHTQTQSLMGMFINLLPLRAQLEQTDSVKTLIGQIHKVIAGAKDHQDMPFEQLLDALVMVRDTSRHPIFQVMFGLQSFGESLTNTPELPFSPVDLDDSLYSPAKFDLSLFLSDGQTCLTGSLNYAVSLFSEATAGRLADYYQRVLAAFIEDHQQRLADINILSEQECRTLLHHWNQTDAPYPQDHTLQQLFETQVEKTPDNAALVFEGETLTYRQLNERANQLACVIRAYYRQQHGEALQADMPIALYFDRSPEMVISMLAVLKAGGAYVPILPAYPAERVQFILADTTARCILTQQHHLTTLATYCQALPEQPALIAADDHTITAEQPVENPARINTPTDLAYIIYTSGTTGQPKGVMIEHNNVAHMAAAQTNILDTPKIKKALMFAAYVFDGSVFELFPCLFRGITLYLCSETERNVISVAQLIQREGIEAAALPPAMLKLLTDTELPSLRVLVTAGEAPSSDFIKHFRQTSRVLNSYGPTEVTVCATEKQFQQGDIPANIGKAINNVRLYVLDEQGHLSPVGTPGELYIGGAGLARGYLNQPELTAERFVPNHFATAEDRTKGYTRLYRTGDLVRWLANGELEYLGRNDFQVKIRGYRIELSEIERSLTLHPQVKQAVVIDHEYDGNKTLVAYLVIDGELTDDVLIRHLSARLPEYMLPTCFTRINAIPLTVNNKVDRRALPEPVFGNKMGYVAPRNELETRLCAIWQDVLGLEQVGIEDNFFRIGGNSLTAIKLTAAIQRILATEISLTQLFELKTIAELATQMREKSYTVIPHLAQEHYPLSFAQERMLFIEQFEQGSNAYHAPYLVQLDNEISLPLLESAINRLAERHSVIKTVYRSNDEGQIDQQVLNRDLKITSQSCENMDVLLSAVRTEIGRPFNLTTEFSLRLCHYQVADSHYLLLLWHHIAIDGWSIAIFMAELAEIYQALRDNRPCQLAPLDITYGDYAVWQRDDLQGDRYEHQLSYWQQTLAGYEPLALPADYPRPAQVSYQGRDFNFVLDTRLSEQLRTLAKAQETTLYTVLLSAFYVTLAKLSGQDDIVIGTPTDNRHHAQTQSLIGMFVNSLVLRTQLEQTTRVENLIQQIHQLVTEAKAHQDMPFEQLLEILGIERDTSRHPIFQVMFGLQNPEESLPQGTHLPFNPVILEEPLYSPAKFDLHLYLSDGQSGISGCLNYAVSLFNETTIMRLADIYQRVLVAFVADQKQPLFGLDILSGQERHTLLHRWDQAEICYPQDKTLPQLFEAQADKTPNNVALIFEDETLTYRQLNERANQLAVVIRERYQQQHHQPMPTDTLVALYLARSPEMVISILAVLKAGGAYVPVSPEYPPEQVRFILEDSQTPCVVTQQRHLEALKACTQTEMEQPALIAADDPAVTQNPSTENLAFIHQATDLAYVIYTSGTTGQPKGVLQTHENVARLFASTQADYQFDQNDIWVLYHAYTFDFSVWELWGALLYGGRLIIPTLECTKDFDRFSRLCSTQNVTVLNQTPGAFYAFIDAALNIKAEFPHLRYVIFGGDKLNPAQLKPWWDHYGDQTPALINMYGITETTVHVTYKKLTANDVTTVSCIGRPLRDMSAYILNQFGKLAPIGTPGELYIGGAGLARGYLNRPELTAERFVQTPFASEKDQEYGYTRLYKTGDLARWLPNGELEYLGRNDFQVKIRGYRIELGEIESALASHPQIKQAVVIDREYEGNKTLVAYLVIKGELTDDALTGYLSSRLPEYMLPASFTSIEAIPLTKNGKVDRRALPEPVFGNKTGYVAPRNTLEAQLCTIWQDVLGLEQVGIEDNFFRIGGNSLTAIKLTAAIRRMLTTEVSLAQLFELKTIAGLVTQMEKQTYTIIPHLNLDRYPLSFAQERMLFIEQFEQGSDTYHIPYLVQLDDESCLPLLETAINRLAERHPVIKMLYQPDDNGQIYQQEMDCHLVIQSQSCETMETLLSTVQAEIATPFDLSNEPSLRLCHYQVADSHYLLLLWHHIAFDGWSADIFNNELAEIYQALQNGRDYQLTPLEINYGDYAVWQRHYLQGDNYEQQLAYWQHTLTGYVSLDLPTDYPRPAQVNYQGQDFSFELDIALSEQLRTLAKTQETTLYTVLLSAFYVTLAKLTGQDDIVLGTPTDNRHYAQTQPLIGMFVNSLVLRAQLKQTTSVEKLVKQTHQQVSEAKAHQDMPFEQLIDALNLERDTSRHPIFQVMFSAQSESESNETHLPFHSVTLEKPLYSPAKFDLSLFLADGKSGITGCLNYAISLFGVNTITRLAASYQRVLSAFVANQQQSLSSIDILSVQERHTLLHDWNQTAAPYPQDKTLPRLFEAQAAQHPEAIAVIFEDQTINYGELNRRANQLAHHLIALGVRPDDRIAICLERSPEMIVGLLAILKAGGAYVPLDPTYPTERLNFMLADSAPVALLTQTTHVDKLSGSVTTVLLDEQARSLATLPETDPDTQALGLTSRHLAYVTYTSGSTGLPKGVMVEHRNVLRLIINNGFADIGPDDCIAHCANISFDAATWEVWSGLVNGARILLVPEKTLLQPAEFGQCLSAAGVSALFLTTALFNQYADLIAPALSGLRYVLFGGEQSDNRAAMRLRAEHSPQHLLHVYGPTETTTFATAYDMPRMESGKLPIGQPINNTRIYILDNQGQPVPAGVPGEIHIGGDGVARGYLNRPELTAERFLIDPFSPEPNARMYKTGDLARWLPDGNIEYLSRNDFQVKLRGFRIELGEIENALTAHPQIKQAVVIDREHHNHKVLIAYLVTEGTLSNDSLMEYLSSRLPEYMLPASFSVIESIPLTLNGKVDRRALPEPIWGNQEHYTAPRNALETQLCHIWQDVLGLEQISVDDNFFRIGGDSIVSIQLVSRLRQAGFTLQVKAIFEAPTVAQLARLLAQAVSTETVIAEQGWLTGEFELLPVQKTFFDWDFANPHHWNQAFMIQIPGHIKSVQVEQALIMLAERHDMLRTRFIKTETGYRQCYSAEIPDSPSLLQHGDIREFDQEALHQQLTQWQSGFDYHNGPLWQAAHLIGYADGSARLFFAFHHLIIDAVSWRIIAEDMRLLLQGMPLRPKTSSYRQWVAAVHHYAEQHQNEVAYWQQVMAGHDAKPAQDNITRHPLSLSTEMTDILLHEANNGYHTEINDLLLSALALALQDIFAQPVNHITLEGHGREHIDNTLDVSETVGWFTTLYPVQLQTQSDITETIMHTKEMLRGVPNKGIGYSTLHQAGYLSGDLPAISFNYLGQLGGASSQDWSITSDDCGNAIASENSSHLLLGINGAIQDGRLQFSVDSRLPKNQTTMFITAFEHTLNSVITMAQAQAQSGGIKTPSDYGIEGLSVRALNQLQQQYQIEALYPATSLQQGFVYHYLAQPQDDAYRVQWLLDYHANVDTAAYQQAWALASLRFPTLRTAFDWEEKILQVITTEAGIGSAHFRREDLTQLSEADCNRVIDEIQQTDRTQPFDLSQPGLVRFTMIQQREQLTTVLITLHHSIVDGWSTPILLQAVHGYYNAIIQGELPEITVDQAYPATQQYYLDHKAESDRYWAKRKIQFQGANDFSALLSHSIDLTQVKTVEKPAAQLLTLQESAYQQLKAICRTQGVTLNVALQFAWHKLLHSYTSDEQTIVGTTISGRDVPVSGIEDSVGLYINTLPLMVRWDHTDSVATVLQAIQQDIAALNSHSDVALSSLQSDGERLFHSLLVFENYPVPAVSEDMAGIEHTLTFRKAVEKVDYPVLIMAYEQDNRLVIKFSYGEDWLTKEQAQHLLCQLERILYAVASNPHQPHTSVSFLSEEERHTLLYRWNQTAAPYPQDKTLPQLFEAQADQHPEAIAVIFEGQSMSYGELNARANRLAHHLIALGVRPDDRVAVCLERSPEMVVGLLAILKAGGAYVPLDPAYPTERLSFMLADSAPVALLTQTTQADKLSGTVTTVLLDTQAADLATLPETDPDTQALGLTSRHLAYVTYTSGSTGLPKGVMVEHRNVLRLIINNGFADIGPDDCIAHCANISFDAATWEVWSGLINGARILLVPEKTLLQPAEFGQCLSNAGVSALFLTTALFNQYADLIAPALSGLRYVLFGGEKSDNRAAMRLRAEYSPQHLLHVYGPTETTTFATAYDMPRMESGKLPIGRPINNTRIYILDNQGQPVPAGMPGEIHIGGGGVARGYLNQPELTAERFLFDPFSPEPNARMYKTGDLARWLPDGNIEYLSRNDFQVKLRGFRIELGEIESALTSHPQVKQAVVIDREHHGHKALAAYLVTDGQASDESLLEHLSAQLPDYMLPASFSRIDAIPLTLNGKVDRRALPDPVWGNRDSYVAPRNALETQLCTLWQDVLGLERISIDDNFFRIGGDSIISIQLVSRLRQAGFTLQVTSIIEAPTVAQLAQLLMQETAADKIIAEQGLLNGEFDLLPVQQMFFDWALTKPHHWNQAFMIRLPGDIKSVQIEQALMALTERHDMLRAHFVRTAQGYRQCYPVEMPFSQIPFPHCDIRGLNKETLHQQLTQWQNHFNYDNGPLWQAAHLTGYADGSARLFFAAHHLIIDVVSWRIIAEDIRRILQGETLPIKTSSYRQWVKAIRQYAEQHQQEVAYWQQALAETATQTTSDNLSQHTLNISAALTGILLREANAGYQTDINDLLLSALALALPVVFSQSINPITLEGHGRENIDHTLDVSETIGWFTTLYPVRLAIQSDIAETIIHTKEMLRSVPNKGIGYGALRQTGTLSGDLPAISFNYLGQLGGESEQDWALTRGDTGNTSADENHSHLLLNINGLVQAGQLQFQIGSRLTPDQTQTFIAAFEQALRSVITTAQKQAQSGGIKTPADYGIKGLSIKLLRQLQQVYQIEALFPATSLQQGFIYHHLAQPQDDAYCVQILLDYHTQFDFAAYQQAWALASLRFPILRTAFNWTEEVLQIITEEASISTANFSMKDIRSLPEDERHNAISTIQQRDRALPFDFSLPGLIRFTLIQQHEQLVTVLTTLHHSIIDGWSNPILLQTVHGYYNAIIQGDRPEIRVDRAYPATQQYYLDHQAESDRYWAERKAQFQGTNDLSTLLSHRVDLSQIKTIEHPAEQGIILQGSAYEQLKNTCRTQGVTLNVALQFAWHKLLNSYTGDEQTIVGTTVSGRDVPVEGIADSVGLYINTLPLMVQWDHTDSIAAVLQVIQQDIAALNSHSAVSLSGLQSDGERLFHSLLVFENYPVPVADENNSGIEHTVAFRQSVEKVDYPLSLMAYEQDNRLIIKLSYGEDWLTEEQTQRLLDQLERILFAVMNDPHQPHTEITFFSEEERHTLLHSWNQTNVPYPQDKTLQQLFETQVETTPDNVALVFEGETLTYRQLNEQANQLAYVIRACYQQQNHKEMPANTPIALYLDRSLEMVISILAVLKAGGAYVPISPEYPAERVQFILSDTAAGCVLTQKRHLITLEAYCQSHKAQPLLIATDDPTVTVTQPVENPAQINSASDLAYIIYTSGTTGQPKGVMVEHTSVNNLSQFIIRTHSLYSQTRTLFFANYVFDASVFEIFPALIAGASLYLAPATVTVNSEQLLAFINAHAITRAFIPTALMNHYSADLFRSSLQIIHTGGETLNALNLPPAITVFNQYGPTEITVCATQNLLQGDDLSIGSGIDNTRLYVLDCHGNPVPVGAPGELYIGGAGVARGYLNQPELTAERFVLNPFASEEDKTKGYTRLYKTGDRVRWQPDGKLEYLSRNDFQVKIRGFRIELGEIESALSSHPQVKQAVVVDHEHIGNTVLVAYLVTDDKLSDDTLRGYISSRLPEYMLPASFTRIESIPLTVNGKLNRRALPEPVWGNSDHYVAPRNELETRLCAIWQEILGVEQVGIEDNFFRIGGNSLVAIKLTSAIRDTLQIDIPLNILFSGKCISSLSQWLETDTDHAQPSLLNFFTPESTATNKLFMIHPANGGSEVYESLASALSDTYNCIGINNYNLSTDNPTDSLYQLANIYRELILAETTIDQPIYILGWSLGGQLAMEIAFQLEQLGATNIQLFLLDTVLNNEEIKTLREKLELSAINDVVTRNLQKMGATDSYINKILEIMPFENSIANCELSGQLNQTNITLFKAGQVNSLNKGEIELQISQLIIEIPDNNISQWSIKPLVVKRVTDYYHENMIDAVYIISTEAVNLLGNKEDVLL
ncbi:non-ribosomal peptide synthase/polyketide synthase [Xenorhabdus bharatensis]|uniref:non-ribosomal peptide synthase/polyketide synthase n=1 Tax=Xenorhabdus bharatensis TaxID=3136256 RepID=UPI003BF61123